MKVLIAVDGSATSERAVRFVVQHRDILGAKPEVTLVFVDTPVARRIQIAVGAKQLSAWRERSQNEAFKTARTALRRSGIAFKEVALTGDPGQAIAQLAQAKKVGLIVMGSHGRTALKNVLLGSVATKVLASCTVPVLIVR